MPRLQLNIGPFNRVSRDLLNIMWTIAHFCSQTEPHKGFYCLINALHRKLLHELYFEPACAVWKHLCRDATVQGIQSSISVRPRKTVHLTGLGVMSSMAVIRTQLLGKKEYFASQYFDTKLDHFLVCSQVQHLWESCTHLGAHPFLPCLFNSGFRAGFPKYTYFPCLQNRLML